MFSIESNQLEAFRRQSLDAFVQRTVTHLRSRFPLQAEPLSAPDLDALVREAITRGKGFGVTSAYDLERFSECSLLYGRDFGDSPDTDWARRILVQDEPSGRKKMNAIVDHETFVLRPER